MSVPYTIERRTDTGVSNATLGFWLFLASEVMLFGALFSTYALLRVSAADWPSGRDVLDVRLGAINTVVLLAATAILWRARRAPLRRARLIVAVSSVLAAAFLAIKFVEYRQELARGLLPSVSTFVGIYFVLTGVHVLHVAGGLAANAWAAVGRAGEAMAMSRIGLLSVYWAFVDVVWVVIFVLMYLA